MSFLHTWSKQWMISGCCISTGLFKTLWNTWVNITSSWSKSGDCYSESLDSDKSPTVHHYCELVDLIVFVVYRGTDCKLIAFCLSCSYTLLQVTYLFTRTLTLTLLALTVIKHTAIGLWQKKKNSVCTLTCEDS